MSNKTINTIANVVLPIVVIIATIAVFLLLKTQNSTALFYINLCYAVFLEVVFFGYLTFLRAKVKDLSVPFFASLGVYCLYYIIAGIAWMLVYSLKLVYFMPLNIHIAVLVVLTLIWIIVSVLTAQTDSNYKQGVDKLKGEVQSLNFYKQKITLLASRYENLCKEKGLKYQTESSNRTELERLKGKISFLTPNVLRNEAAAEQLTALIGKCEGMVSEMEEATAETAPDIQKRMVKFVDNAIGEVDMLRARG